MTAEAAGGREEESPEKDLARFKWLSGHWYASARENLVTNAGGRNMGVFPVKFKPGRWACRIENKFYPGSHASVQEAKRALFEEYWSSMRR